MNIKVASFNVNSIRARLNILLNWVRKETPGINWIFYEDCI